MSLKDAPYRAFLQRRALAGQHRTLDPTEPLAAGRVRRDGATLLNFAGNDYLGLSRHPTLIARMRDDAERYGTSATASRLVAGDHPLYAGIEATLAAGKGTAAALVLGGGYAANLTVLAALADLDGATVTILADRLSHHSLLQGAQLGGARLLRFRHNDYDHLARLLTERDGKHERLIIVTESVFGMDGDRADLGSLATLAERFGALLYIDEAHATGLFGHNGFGFCADHAGRIDIAMGTFGKALGSFGAYIGCSAVLRDYLINRCGGLIYSTALPPPVLGAITAALELLPQLNVERAHLQGQATRLRQALTAQGWDCGGSTTQIIPLILGGETAALDLAARLRRQGILAPAIRPPTVPQGTSRLRLSLSAAHDVAAIDTLIAALAEAAPDFAQGRAA